MIRRRIVAVAALLLAVAGCASPLPQPSPPRPQAAVPAAVDESQLLRVLSDIGEHLTDADETADAGKLAPRVADGAAQVRKAEYQIVKSDESQTVTALPVDPSAMIVPATLTWPRSALVVTQPPADSQTPRLLVLTQSSPRAQYQLVTWSKLLPGIEMPRTAPVTEGSQPLAADASGLVLTPEAATAAFADVLLNGSKSEHAGQFGEEPLSGQLGEELAALRAGISEIATITRSYTPVEGAPVVLETVDGGAIMVAQYREVSKFTITAGSLTVGSQTALLLGADSVKSNLTTTHALSVVMHIPAAGAEGPIEVLGETRDLIAAQGE